VTTRQVDETGATVGYVSTPVALDGSTRPTTGTSIRVRVNRYLDPASASRQALCVQSSTDDVPSIVACSAGLVLRPSYDPVSRTAAYFLETDQTQLAPDTLYRITLFRRAGEDGFGLRAFDGPALGGPFVLEFRTESPHPDGPAPTDGPDTSINFCKPTRCFAVCGQLPEEQRAACAETCTPGIEDALESCAFGGCHQTTADQKPPMGLDLYAPEGLQATAIARVAHGSMRGAGAQNADLAGLAFGRAMPLIAPGDPGNSYLLYKVLAHPGFDPAVAAPAQQLAPGLEAGESERLRASVIVGSPMPPTSNGDGPEAPAVSDPLAVERALRISRWIAAGADTTRCGPALVAP
jgi:hypothetical protein